MLYMCECMRHASVSVQVSACVHRYTLLLMCGYAQARRCVSVGQYVCVCVSHVCACVRERVKFLRTRGFVFVHMSVHVCT